MKAVHIDLTPFEDKKSLHNYLKEALDFPNYYGANLDALHDELSSVCEPIKLTVSYPKQPRGDMAGYIPRVLEVFRDAACMNYNLNLEVHEETEAGEQAAELSLQEVYIFLKQAKTYYLATAEKNGQPRVRPFGTVDLFEGKIYIQTGKTKQVSMQLHENPLAELCAFQDGRWLRLAGELVPDERYEAKKHMLDAYPELQSMYSPEDDHTEVLYFRNARAAFYSFTKAVRELNF